MHDSRLGDLGTWGLGDLGTCQIGQRSPLLYPLEASSSIPEWPRLLRKDYS